MMKTCPFKNQTSQISDNACTTTCALNINNKCAFTVIAENSSSKDADHSKQFL